MINFHSFFFPETAVQHNVLISTSNSETRHTWSDRRRTREGYFEFADIERTWRLGRRVVRDVFLKPVFLLHPLRATSLPTSISHNPSTPRYPCDFDMCDVSCHWQMSPVCPHFVCDSAGWCSQVCWNPALPAATHCVESRWCICREFLNTTIMEGFIFSCFLFITASQGTLLEKNKENKSQKLQIAQADYDARSRSKSYV